MSDIFIAYARSTAKQGHATAEALRALGYSVWIDEDLPSHRPYTDVIAEQLAAAKAVVVIWSADAAASEWVRSEANRARSERKLVQLRVADTRPPMPFDQVQCADLSGWSGEGEHPAWPRVVASVAALVSGPTDEGSPTAPSLPSARSSSGSAANWAAIEDSLDADDYADFLEIFPRADEAFAARRHKRRLEAWARIDQADLLAVATFLKTDSFSRLQDMARRIADDLAAAAERSGQLRVPATAQPSDARAAAVAGRAVLARSFAVGAPGVAAWPHPVMVAIPPGRFLMGSQGGEERWQGYDSEEEPQHEVAITHVFALGRGAVTVDAFAAFIAETGHDMGESALVLNGDTWGETTGRGWRDPGFVQAGDHPVTCVSWHDARSFTAWLNDRLKLTDRLDAYRLPSEAEWEYACRAGTATPFSFGATLSSDQANFNGRAGYGEAEPSMVWRRATTPAGRFPGNAFGLYDMHGNTWDWCEDAWNRTYDGAPTDASARLTGNVASRVLRGGSWLFSPRYCRSAQRLRMAASVRTSGIGFRLARTLSSPAT